MKFFLAMFSLVCFSLCSTNYSLSGDTFSWPNITVDNSAVTTLAVPPALPYQIAEDVSPNLMRGYYDFTGIPSMCKYTIYTNPSPNIRADSSSIGTFPISMNISSSSGWNALQILAAFNRSTGGSTLFLLIQLSGTAISPTCYGLNETATVSGVSYAVGVTSLYCMLVSGMSTNYTGTIDMRDVAYFLIQQGYLVATDRMIWFGLQYLAGEAGMFSLSTSWNTGPNTQTIDPTQITVGGLTISNVYYVQNLSSTDYCNLTYPLAATNLSGFAVDFRFLDRLGLNVSLNLTQAYPAVYVGRINAVWYTPQGLYGLPVAADNITAGMLIGFSFQEANIVTTSKAACIGLVLRNDYNSTTLVFSNSSIHPTLEIEICPWWSPNIPASNATATVTDGASIYDLYCQTAFSTDGINNWTTYIFASRNYTLNSSSLDVLSFSKYVHTSVVSLSGYYVVGMTFGFRIYTGRGSFTYTDSPQVSSVTAATGLLIPYEPPLPNSSLAEPMCVLSSYNVSNQNCVMSTLGKKTYNLFLDILSFPNAVLFLQLSPITTIVDEFSYYAYHKSQYDRGFIFISGLCWQFNNEKWVPPMLSGPYEVLNHLLDGIQINDWAHATPARFIARSETVYFLNNAQNFLFVSLPLTLIAFLLVWLVRNKLDWWILRSVLSQFSTFSYLIVLLVGDNIQYLSFRSFQQLRFIVPKSLLEGTSIVLCLVALFIVVVCCASMYLLIWSFDRKRYSDENFQHILQSFGLLTLITICRAANGFSHAYLDEPSLQLSCLLASTLISLIFLIRYSWVVKFKQRLCTYIGILGVKVLIEGILLVEIWQNFDISIASPNEIELSNVMAILSYSLILLLVVQYISAAIITGVSFVQSKCSKKVVEPPKSAKKFKERCSVIKAVIFQPTGEGDLENMMENVLQVKMRTDSFQNELKARPHNSTG